ncbi:MAG: helix-turn-helix domain-containing protein [Lachnospiraceae bacterium]|nr:helix-turn-helix domain-containing protein [Lachnospiraceae bacterium]
MKFLNGIDAGNSNITEQEAQDIITFLNGVADPKLSKYQACQLLNCSRATFDNLVREGKLPEGKRQAGFKEKFWNKQEILKYITSNK